MPWDCRQSVQGFRWNVSDWAGSVEAFAAELLRLQIAHDVSRRASTCWPQERKRIGSAECAARQPAQDSAGCVISLWVQIWVAELHRGSVREHLPPHVPAVQPNKQEQEAQKSSPAPVAFASEAGEATRCGLKGHPKGQ